MVLACSAFLIQPVYSSSERSQSIILVNIHRSSPIFCNLSCYLSPPTRLLPIPGSQILARAILSFCYSHNITYIIDLNSIIHRSSPGFETGSPGPKVAGLPLCYTPLTTYPYLVFLTITMIRNFMHQLFLSFCK